MKWVTMYGNAQSIVMPKETQYAKNLTLRYPVRVPFSGEKIRLTVDNFVIDEPVHIESISLSQANGLSDERLSDFTYLTFAGKRNITVLPHQALVSDPIDLSLEGNSYLLVTIYIKDYCNLTGGVALQGPLFKGYYAYGDQREARQFDPNTSMPTNWLYFISNIDIFTSDENECIICYGDSITAQDWPDYLQLSLYQRGIKNVAILRKAVSGTRILREYSCIKYQSYGLNGKHRFLHEVGSVVGAKKIIIQQGINDIIHPVGIENNPFRPMSDLPTQDELIQGMNYYLEQAKSLHLVTYVGTLLPIYGWRTYAPFREALKNEFNAYLRSCSRCVDFEKAVSQEENGYTRFKDGYDSGDHLHPSAKAYQAMGELASEVLFPLKNKEEN